MSGDTKFCYDDEDMDHVIQNLGALQLRRLPVVNREKRLVGVVTLADPARQDRSRRAPGAGAERDHLAPDGQHSQSRH